MRNFPLVLLSSMLLSGPQLLAKNCSHTTSSLKCLTYVSNYDGDTITLNIPKIFPFFGNMAKVRLMGIDAPEIKSKDECESKLAQKAKRRLHSILSTARTLELRNFKKEKYFRIVGELYADGVNVSHKMLKAHLAVPYAGGHKTAVNWCKLKD